MCLKHRQRANRSLTCGLLLIRQAGVEDGGGSWQSEEMCSEKWKHEEKGIWGGQENVNSWYCKV